MTNELHQETLPRPAERRRWPSVLLGIVLVACGFFSGVVVTVSVARARALETLHHPENMPDRVVKRLSWRLNLSEEQAKAVREILRKRQHALFEIRREVQPRVVDELDKVQEEISFVLDDKQREKWNKMFNRLKRLWLPPLPSQPPETEPRIRTD